MCTCTCHLAGHGLSECNTLRLLVSLSYTCTCIQPYILVSAVADFVLVQKINEGIKKGVYNTDTQGLVHVDGDLSQLVSYAVFFATRQIASIFEVHNVL